MHGICVVIPRRIVPRHDVACGLRPCVSMRYWKSRRVKPARSLLRPTSRALRLVPRPPVRTDSRHDADWWAIAAGIGRALSREFDREHPPACA